MLLSCKSLVGILIPVDATERERFAADELEKYLKMMFPGIPVLVGDDTAPAAGCQILLGGPERNRQTAVYLSEEDFDQRIPGPDGLLVQSLAENVLLCAGSSKNPNECERGTIYAVYELLERFMGCSLSAIFNPEFAGGEYIPQPEQLELKDLFYEKARADLPYRTGIVQYNYPMASPLHPLTLPFFDWLAKNRYNRILLWAGTYETHKKAGIIEEAARRGLRFTVGHHQSSCLFIPPKGNEYFSEEYYKTHPEFYKLLEDGSRFEPVDDWGQWIFCSRNPELIDQMAENICVWIDQNPAVDTVALWPHDGLAPQCLCEACRKYTKVENYTYFLNQVAQRVRRVHPHVSIDMLAYVDLWDCPEGLRLEPNIVVQEATWHATGLRTIGNPDGSCLNGTMFEAALLRWKEAGAQVAYYEYFMGVYPARQRYMPAADELQSIYKRMMEVGIRGSGTQIECFNLWNNIFNFFCFGRTAYDTTLSMEENLERFSRIFGEGAPYIRQVIADMEARLDGGQTIMQAGLQLMCNMDMEPVHGLLSEALAAAQSPDARNNIRLFRMALRYSEIECRNTAVRDDSKYSDLEICKDPTGELYYMSRKFDSYHWNKTGMGLMLPLDCQKEAEFIPNIWYDFETIKK